MRLRCDPVVRRSRHCPLDLRGGLPVLATEQAGSGRR